MAESFDEFFNCLIDEETYNQMDIKPRGA